jgi:AraC-like DNA-binding protein
MKQLDGRIFHLQRLLGNGQPASKVVKEMSNTFNVTPLYLKQLFKEQTGQTVLQYDKDSRLEKAKYLIETTHLRINDICYQVGFGDCSHFVRDFKAKYEISPKELQKLSCLERAKAVIANNS